MTEFGLASSSNNYPIALLSQQADPRSSTAMDLLDLDFTDQTNNDNKNTANASKPQPHKKINQSDCTFESKIMIRQQLKERIDLLLNQASSSMAEIDYPAMSLSDLD
jgi:hypothetical protein